MTKKSRPATGTTAASKPRKAPQAGTRAKKEVQAPDTAENATTATSGRRTREGSKQAKLIEMLRAADGAAIDEIVRAFGWQAHTARGVIAGALKKKLGLAVTSEKIEGRGRVYRIAD